MSLIPSSVLPFVLDADSLFIRPFRPFPRHRSSDRPARAGPYTRELRAPA